MVLGWPVKSENDSGRNAASAGDTGPASVFVIYPRPVAGVAGEGFGFRFSLGEELTVPRIFNHGFHG